MVGQDVGALRRHIALIGFMGAGKSTIGREVARLTARPFVDLDEEIEKRHGPIAKIFDERGEPEFRRLEEEMAAGVLAAHELSVIALGGGAVGSTNTQGLLRARALAIWVPVDVETAWRRAKDSDRPLARDEGRFRALYEEREEIYDIVADASAADAEAVLLESFRIDFRVGALALLGKYVESPRAVLVADERVLSLHPVKWNAPWVELVGTHTVPPGEGAKTVAVVERLWQELSLDRSGTIVALGGGSTTDAVGFTAATYLRGIHWIAVPTTLVGQVDAAIGGKTGVDLPDGKNLIGSFHFPERVVLDESVLTTLPDEERRAGMAEVVKTGLLAGRDVWTLPQDEMIRSCAAFKSAVVISDPYETTGRRRILNLGHTFAHALETGSGYTVRHGDAVALGLLAALRLSGQPTDVVEDVLQPQPVRADRDAAWASLKRDKKGEGVFILLEAPGRPVVTTVSEADARKALDALIAK